MRNIKKITTNSFIFIIVLTLLLVPAISFAEPQPLGSLVPCDNSKEHPCGFNELLDMINKVIKFIIFKMAVPIAAIMFFYAGFMMVTAGGEIASARTRAKNIFTNTVFGLILVIAAWLIVRTLLSILGYQGDWIGF